ncbi:sigma-54-dependent transcriptional regulator [Arhodomonas aquaeolei]|uniref:sigma-54-dependent transcriptional regulator n=1 Tax=Arhodomonas aquaeolei TaxID=2369 RepID=UPI00036433CA|nr:sigma-54 dependent transcriptional regulator [Arhodomonas aquaeolei]
MSETATAPVLFIDDEAHIRLAATQTLELAGLSVTACERAAPALARIDREFPGVVVCDIKMPQMDGLAFMREALAIDEDLPVILVTGHGDIAMAVGAMRDGAYDFVEKPYAPETLTEVVRRALEKRRLTLENRSLREELAAQSAPGPRIIGNTPAIQRLRSLIHQVADTGADVLVHGETGTGKELVARSLHEHSSRREGNFVAVNCGAVPDELIESELFGHEAGAFTGARTRRIGKLEHASGGTLFLDEIESMPLAQQVQLLRALQERSVIRVGANAPVPLDLRVVAATKVDLRQAADEGRFRDDLYYRLNVVSLEVPPLRERRDDIPLLFQHFMLVAGYHRYQREVPAVSPEQRSALLAHQWPGNVRELRNVAERYVLLGEHYAFDLDRVLDKTGDGTAAAMSLREQVEGFERALIESALRAEHGNISRATDALGLPRKTLYDKMQKYGLTREQFTE